MGFRLVQISMILNDLERP